MTGSTPATVVLSRMNCSKQGKGGALHVAEVGGGQVGLGLHEHDALRAALHHELPAGLLLQAAGERVVKDERLSKRLPDHGGRVLAPLVRVGTVQVDAGAVEPHALAVVDVGQRLRLPRRRRRRGDQHRLASPHRERREE